MLDPFSAGGCSVYGRSVPSGVWTDSKQFSHKLREAVHNCLQHWSENYPLLSLTRNWLKHFRPTLLFGKCLERMPTNESSKQMQSWRNKGPRKTTLILRHALCEHTSLPWHDDSLRDEAVWSYLWWAGDTGYCRSGPQKLSDRPHSFTHDFSCRSPIPKTALTKHQLTNCFLVSAGTGFDNIGYAELSMEQHVSAVVRSCFFHIRSLSKVRPYITYKAASSIAVCLILSKLDYWNSFLSGLPQKQIKRLQALQNAAARTVMKCKQQKQKRKITSLPFLGSFIGFPSRNGSATKLSLPLTGQFMITALSDLLQKHNPSRLLRSASGSRNSKTKRYGQRAFRYVAPSLWNGLPESIKENDSIQSFRPSLKTHFFT